MPAPDRAAGVGCGSIGAARARSRDTAAAAGIRRRFARHPLRHTHAIEWRTKAFRLVAIQRQLGYSNLGIASVYLQGIDTRRSSKPSTPAEPR